MRKLARLFSSVSMGALIAIQTLRANILRSMLTIMGVMVGVFAVVMSVSVGLGAKLQVMDAVNALGSTMAMIVPVPDGSEQGSYNTRGRLELSDIEAIQRTVDGVDAVAPQLRSSVNASANGASVKASVIGSTEGYFTVTNSTTSAGRVLDDVDVRTAGRVAVLSDKLAERLFGLGDPIGLPLQVNRMTFTVIGTMKAKTGFDDEGGGENMIVIPISTARQRLVGLDASGPENLSVAYVGFADAAQLAEGQRLIKALLRERYHVREGDVAPFTVRTTEEFMKQSQQVVTVFQVVLVSVASISLLVGGMGIMNIMLVSVTERTREIGLRMALGARRSDVKVQFLTEAAVLCILGGGFGLGLAVLVARVFEQVAGWPAPIGVGVALFALLFSAMIGIVFGAYPAHRASKMSPIAALRSD